MANQTLTKKTTTCIGVVLIALLLVFTTVISPLSAGAVTIKTQKKADSLLKEGAIKGIDVSKWQGSIDWSKVANDDIKFTFIRASYGAEEDPYFVSNAQSAHENGVKVGAYHYARFKDTAGMEKEAEFFINQLKKVKITYPVVLDVENSYTLTKKQLTTLCLEFMDKIEKAGYSVMLYSYQNFINGAFVTSMLDDVTVWVANYKEFPSTIPHEVWQHTSYGKVGGVPGRVDINISYNDLSPRKKLVVDSALSQAALTYLNENAGAEMDITSINMDQVNYCAAAIIQNDLATHHAPYIETTGKLAGDDVEVLLTLNGADPNNARILSCIQAKLFYTGFYTGGLTGEFDAHTTEAITAYQQSKGLDPTGTLGRSVLNVLFEVQDSDVQIVEET